MNAVGTAIASPPDAGTVLQAAGITKSYRRGIWPVRRASRCCAARTSRWPPARSSAWSARTARASSTLMKILVGALAPDAGTVPRRPARDTARRSPWSTPRLTCDEHFDLFAHAYGMRRRRRRSVAQDASTSTLGFSRYRHTRADQLSGGTLAKLNLGLALLADPGGTAARRALRRVRLGHLPAVLGPRRRATRTPGAAC